MSYVFLKNNIFLFLVKKIFDAIFISLKCNIYYNVCFAVFELFTVIEGWLN